MNFNRTKIIDKVALSLLLESDVVINYIVGIDGTLERVKDIGDIQTIVSLTDEDFRIVVDNKPLTDKKAITALIEEAGSPSTIKLINKSKIGFVYATNSGREFVSGKLIHPLTQLSDIKNSENGEKKDVYGFSFGNGELLVIFSDTPNGLKQSIITQNDNLQSTLDIFASSNGLPDDYQYVIYTQDDFFDALAQSVNYPQYKKIFGIPEQTFYSALMVASVVGVVVAGGYHWYQLNTIESNNDKVAIITSEKDAVMLEVANYISSHIPGIIHSVNIDDASLFKTAEGLWIPGVYMSVTADRKTQEFSLMMPFSTFTKLRHDGQITNIFSKSNEKNEYCKLESILIGTKLDEITAKYTCQNHYSDLSFIGF